MAQPKWAHAVREQYEVAEAFLKSLADTFLNGDRSRLIMVPGNHDVCWNTSLDAMEVVPFDADKQSIRKDLSAPDSPFRWDWNALKLYRVRDEARYRQRTTAYWDFARRFYSGAELTHPIDPERGYQLFELDAGQIVIAAFDSIHRNDCFSYGGALQPGAAGASFLKLRGLGRPPNLKIAVWHHSVQGPPTSADYMDVNEVHELAGHGFQLGLHGHQHLAAESAYYVHRAEAQKMAVISAGSLCAGSRELPRGVNRQYNIIVVDDEYTEARLHVREMVEGNHWATKRSGAFVDGHVRIDWQRPIDLAGRAIDTDLETQRRAIDEAESALNAGDPMAALEVLRRLNLPQSSYARVLAVRAATDAKLPAVIAEILVTPADASEVVQLVAALEQMGRLQEAKAALDVAKTLDEGTRRAIGERLEIKLRIKGA